MMDVQNAIEILGETKLLTPLGQACFVAIEALKKQVPKKPIVISTGEEEYSGCPVCSKFVFDDYCQCCGQAIDWE